MRGGIHVYLLWLINNNNKILFYNNIRDIKCLDNRIISKLDTRIQDVSSNIVNNELEENNLNIYSIESQLLNDKLLDNIIGKIGNDKLFITIVIRNPYNNFASLLKYIENGGKSIYVHSIVENEDNFINIWLSLTDYILKNKNIIPIFYEKFIESEKYRLKLSNKLNFKLINNQLLRSKFGGGSSFGDKKYFNRYKNYVNNKKMISLLNNNEIKKKWEEINILYNINV